MPEFIAKTTEYLDIIFAQLFSKFIVAIIIILIGFVIARIIGKLVQKFLSEIELNKILQKAGIKTELESMISNLFVYFIYFVTIIWALESLGLTTTILNLISIAFLVLIIVSISLAVKDFFPNIMAGFFIFKKKIIKVGDKIKVENISGKVERITLLETEIKTSSGDKIYIPNSTLTKKEIIVKK